MILDLKSYYLFRGKYVTFYTGKTELLLCFADFHKKNISHELLRVNLHLVARLKQFEKEKV